jgi:ribose-phosphate pyrophosphokinase
LEDFPDDEIYVRIQEEIHGDDVFLIQPTSAPVALHLLELMLLADACRRGGAARLTAVIPYYGYARQDRRVLAGETVAARVIADILRTGFDRVIAVDLHTAAIEGFFDIPLEHVSAVPLLAEALRPWVSREHVVVAPDLGAVKLAQRYADLLDLPVVYAHKVRMGGRKTRVHRIIGEVKGRAPLIVDDMISTGATMISTMAELLNRECSPHVTLAASHGLFVEEALERFSSFPVEGIWITDSVVPVKTNSSIPLHVAGIKDLIAEVITRLHSS